MALSKLGYSLLCVGFGGLSLFNDNTSNFGYGLVWISLLAGIILTGVLSD